MLDQFSSVPSGDLAVALRKHHVSFAAMFWLEVEAFRCMLAKAHGDRLPLPGRAVVPCFVQEVH